MTNELKPCPFCGWNITAFNEDLYRVNISGNDHWVHLRCVHCGATAQGRGNTKEAAEHQAQDRWNTRAERTCKNERFHYAPYEYDVFTCSKCGGSVYEIDGKWAVKGRDGDYEYDAVILFCPLCGARVEGDA